MEKTSLGPQPASPGPALPLSGARAAILDLLRAAGGPRTVEELAGETGQHPNTVREHLEALVGAGRAELVDGPPLGEGRRGRPAKHYRAVERPESVGYAGLAGVLAAEVARLAPDPERAGVEAGRSWARRTLGAAVQSGAAQGDAAGGGTAGSTPAAAVPAADARRRVLAELDELGFGVEEPQSRGARAKGTVRLVACPLLAAAKDEPGVVCSVHAGLVEESLRLLGHPELGSALEPFAEPGACLLTIGRA